MRRNDDNLYIYMPHKVRPKIFNASFRNLTGNFDVQLRQESADDGSEQDFGAFRNTSDKLRSEFQQRQTARDELVASVRKYGVYLLGALVLFPLPLVVLAAVCVMLYIMARHSLRGGSKASTAL